MGLGHFVHCRRAAVWRMRAYGDPDESRAKISNRLGLGYGIIAAAGYLDSDVG